MILTIIAISILALGIIALIAWKVGDYYSDGHLIGSISLSAFGAVGLLIAIVLAAAANNPTKYEMAKNWYEESVTSLKATQVMIGSIKDDYARSVAIRDYNNDVKTFKIKILENQEGLKNPFINWFYCAQYATLDPNVVDYISFVS